MISFIVKLYIIGVIITILLGIYSDIGKHRGEWLGFILAAILWPVVLVRVLTPGTVDRKI